MIKALYHADLDYSYTSDFINNNLRFYAPLNIQRDINKNQLQDYDVKHWIGTIHFVVSRAKELCDKSAKEAKAFNLN